VIAELLPDAVRSAEVFGDPPQARLLPDEEPYVARATAGRRAEFTSARWCARQALAQLGYPPTPVLVGDRGVPRWPDGVTGSLTHSDGYRAAAVAYTTEVLSIGIDAEPHAPLPHGVEGVISSPGERQHLADLAQSCPAVHWDRLMFCAKESTYKAWFPLTYRWLGFKDAAVTFDPDTNSFTASLLVPGPQVAGRALTRFSGSWSAEDRIALTAVAVLR
jgi:4'-phosphopantetheinyl transferase EntD